VGSALWQAVLVGRARREVLEASRAGRRGANDSYLRAVPEPDGGE